MVGNPDVAKFIQSYGEAAVANFGQVGVLQCCKECGVCVLQCCSECGGTHFGQVHFGVGRWDNFNFNSKRQFNVSLVHGALFERLLVQRQRLHVCM